MKTKAIAMGALVALMVLSMLLVPAATAFVHPRGIIITVYPQQLTVFFSRPASYTRNLAVIIKPGWYFVEDLMKFDSVTLTLTLTEKCHQCRHYGDPPRLLGGSDGQLVISLGSVTMEEDDNGAWLNVPITFVISSSTGRGYFMLYCSAEAVADGAVFKGWDQIPVAIVPGISSI